MSVVDIWGPGVALGSGLSAILLKRTRAFDRRIERKQAARLFLAAFPGLTFLTLVLGVILADRFGAAALLAIVPLSTATFYVSIYALYSLEKGPG